MPLNIIIKNKNPHWRPLQTKLGHFKSLHKKDSRIVDPSLSVKEMFSKEERLKIDMAALHTQRMEIDFQKEENAELRLRGLERKPNFK